MFELRLIHSRSTLFSINIKVELWTRRDEDFVLCDPRITEEKIHMDHYIFHGTSFSRLLMDIVSICVDCRARLLCQRVLATPAMRRAAAAGGFECFTEDRDVFIVNQHNGVGVMLSITVQTGQCKLTCLKNDSVARKYQEFFE